MKKKFYEPIYFANVILDVSKMDGRLDACVETVEDKEKKVHYIVHVEDKKDFYSLMHECLHLVKRVFTDRGIPFDDKNDEAIAYYFTYWFKTLWRAMNK